MQNNFSPLGNFISSFLKHHANRLTSNTVVGAGAAERSVTNALINQNKVVQNQTQMQNNTNLALAKMESTERAALVKDLLNLPTSLKDLIATLQSQNTLQNTSGLIKLSDVNINQLMELMQTNGKEALAKLVQLTSMLNKQGVTDTKQLQELQFIINACMPNANMTNVQFMKNLILLYLPWLPIGENNNFDIDFTAKEEERENEASDTITILIQTQNYGNVKVLIMLEATNKINISINCIKEFPKEKLNKILKDNATEYKLETGMEFIETENAKKEELNQERKVHMSGASVLNPYILLMAHSVIKEVIEIDKSKSLDDVRKSAINDNKG